MPAITDEKRQQCLEIYRAHFPGGINEGDVDAVLKTAWLSNLRTALEAERMASVAPVTEAEIEAYKSEYYKRHKQHIASEHARNAIFSGRLNGLYWNEQVVPYERQLAQQQELMANMPADQWLVKAMKSIIGEYQRLVAKGGREMTIDAYTKAYITRAAQWMVAPSQKPWLMLRGGVGTGKTTLAYAVRHALLDVQQRGVTAVDAISMANAYISQDRAQQDDFKEACNCRSLLLDDLGAEPAKVMSFGNAISPMEVLLDVRYRNRMKDAPLLIITTNLSDEELTDRYGERIASRLNDVCEVIKYDGAQPDYRKQPIKK